MKDLERAHGVFVKVDVIQGADLTTVFRSLAYLADRWGVMVESIVNEIPVLVAPGEHRVQVETQYLAKLQARRDHVERGTALSAAEARAAVQTQRLSDVIALVARAKAHLLQESQPRKYLDNALTLLEQAVTP